MLNSKFTYIVPFYFGDRMATQYIPAYKQKMLEDKFYFAKKHIEFLENYSNNDLEKIIFVINQRDEDDVNEINEFFEKNTKIISSKTNLKLLFRDNVNISYGAWNDAICDDIENEDNQSLYYFCLEDDYIPTTFNFVYPFIERCNDKTPYVCCKAVFDDFYIAYASISNGIFLKKSCEQVYQKNNFIFLLNPKDSNIYSNACYTQQTFYRPFLDMGYTMTDILDQYSAPFFCSVSNKITIHGQENLEALLRPITI